MTAFDYSGPARDAVPGGHDFALRVSFSVSGTQPVDLLELRQGYPGLTVAARRGLPYSVMPGQSAPLDVEYTVVDCAAAPPDAGLPYLDVTLRNVRAIQTLSQILGDRYAADLSRNLHIACPESDIRTSVPKETTPDGSVR
ncbi:hypothetical protein ACIRPK_25105 [Kitasatospora sp. NPDC101801]|uniref:hypothetical protein n=1 Tax=Kitasatospora sp. NPDC101801 TaxID=3364103 RepID=UPI00382A86D7